jgi:hypothetical protein
MNGKIKTSGQKSTQKNEPNIADLFKIPRQRTGPGEASESRPIRHARS